MMSQVCEQAALDLAVLPGETFMLMINEKFNRLMVKVAKLASMAFSLMGETAKFVGGKLSSAARGGAEVVLLGYNIYHFIDNACAVFTKHDIAGNVKKRLVSGLSAMDNLSDITSFVSYVMSQMNFTASQVVSQVAYGFGCAGVALSAFTIALSSYQIFDNEKALKCVDKGIRVGHKFIKKGEEKLFKSEKRAGRVFGGSVNTIKKVSAHIESKVSEVEKEADRNKLADILKDRIRCNQICSALQIVIAVVAVVAFIALASVSLPVSGALVLAGLAVLIANLVHRKMFKDRLAEMLPQEQVRPKTFCESLESLSPLNGMRDLQEFFA